MVCLHTGTMGVHPACFFIDWAARVATPERNRPENTSPYLAHPTCHRAPTGEREERLAQRHLHEGAFVLYDVTSSYYEGKTCPLARFGYDRDGKTGCSIIVYGMLTDADGRPVAVHVYPGNTADPKTVPDQVETLARRFGLSRVVLVGDRGMLTQTQIDVLKKHPGLGWISALRSGSIRRLLADGLLVRKDLEAERLAEITSPEFPGERL